MKEGVIRVYTYSLSPMCDNLRRQTSHILRQSYLKNAAPPNSPGKTIDTHASVVQLFSLPRSDYVNICHSLYFDVFTRVERLMFSMKDITQLI